jgi:hypothetical protein
MGKIKALVNTDQVNKQQILISLAQLVSSTEDHIVFLIRNGLPLGSPSYISHDTTRLAGWTSDIAIVMSRDIGRQTAFIYYPDTAAEKVELEEAAAKYTEVLRKTLSDPFIEELQIRAKLESLDGTAASFIHSAVLERKNLAAELYPDFFQIDSDNVDKDGLTFYSELIKIFSEVQPGIFHDKRNNLLLFAHPYFRRSFSRKNSLNQYFLSSLSEAAKRSGVDSRIRLDPDLIGHPESLKYHFEFEYWHGPNFSDDIESIPDGVSVHKADETTRLLESIDKTNLWWKQPESRIIDGKECSFRTFEAEELVEEPSAELGNDVYGCRYVHAEYSVDHQFLSHFDGAIRAYPALSFMERIEKNIDRAGKHSIYSKVFRLDGAIHVSLWKSLVVDFFKGNKLLPEYFGFKESLHENHESHDAARNIPELSALISFDKPEEISQLAAVADESCPLNGEMVECVDINRGACGSLIDRLVDVSGATLLICQDKTINLPRLILEKSSDTQKQFSELALALADAIIQDKISGLLEKASIAIAWSGSEVMTTISIAGEAQAVSSLLRDLPNLLDVAKSASEWVGSLNDRLKALAPIQIGPLDPLPIVSSDGRLRLKHHVDETLPAELITQDTNLHDRLASSDNVEK